MIFKGDPWNSWIEHDFIMYCPKCNKRQCADIETPVSMQTLKKMRCPNCSTPLVDIDAMLEEIVILLNTEYQTAKGIMKAFETVQCCNGHFVDIYKNFTPYITLATTEITFFPINLLNNLTSAEISYNVDMSQFDTGNKTTDEMNYIGAVNGDRATPRRLLTIRMNTDNIIQSFSDERDFPGYSEKAFDRRRQVFISQLRDFALAIVNMNKKVYPVVEDETPIEKYLKKLNNE